MEVCLIFVVIKIDLVKYDFFFKLIKYSFYHFIIHLITILVSTFFEYFFAPYLFDKDYYLTLPIFIPYKDNYIFITYLFFRII